MSTSVRDRAVTVFSADGHLLQVQYASEAARKGSAVVGVRGRDCIVLASETKIISSLQQDRTDRRIVRLDKHIVLAFAGLRADARVVVTRAQIECQAHRLTVEDPATTLYITKFISEMQQKYTQSNGRRPFGISCLIAGFDSQDGSAHLYQTDPSGYYYEWKARAIGRNDRQNQTFLDTNYNIFSISSDEGCIKLALRTLLATAQPGFTDFDVVILRNKQPEQIMPRTEVRAIVRSLTLQDKKGETSTTEKKSRWPFSRSAD